MRESGGLNAKSGVLFSAAVLSLQGIAITIHAAEITLTFALQAANCNYGPRKSLCRSKKFRLKQIPFAEAKIAISGNEHSVYNGANYNFESRNYNGRRKEFNLQQR